MFKSLYYIHEMKANSKSAGIPDEKTNNNN